MKIIENIIWRYIELNIFQDFLNKVLSVLSSLFEKNEKNKKNLQLFNNSSISATDPINEDEEKEIIHSQKNSLIIELMRIILEMKSLEINDEFQPILAKLFYKNTKKTKKEHKGLLKLLTILGDPKELLKNYLKKNEGKEGENNIKTKFTEQSEENEENLKKFLKKNSKIKKKIDKNEKSDKNIEKNEKLNKNIEKNENSKEINEFRKEKNQSEFLIVENDEVIFADADDESLNEEELDIMKKYGLSLKNKKNRKKPINTRKSLNNLPYIRNSQQISL